jgi:hypothetical protein
LTHSFRDFTPWSLGSIVFVGVSQVVEHLLWKHKALSPAPCLKNHGRSMWQYKVVHLIVDRKQRKRGRDWDKLYHSAAYQREFFLQLGLTWLFSLLLNNDIHLWIYQMD